MTLCSICIGSLFVFFLISDTISIVFGKTFKIQEGWMFVSIYRIIFFLTKRVPYKNILKITIKAKIYDTFFFFFFLQIND